MEVDGQLQAAAALPPGRASNHFVGDWFGLRTCPGVLSLSGFEIRQFVCTSGGSLVAVLTEQFRLLM